jgi:hypothetical protein
VTLWLAASVRLALLTAAGVFFVRRTSADTPWSLALALGHLAGAATFTVGVTLGMATTGSASLAWGVGGLLALAGSAFVKRTATRRVPATRTVPATRPGSRGWRLGEGVLVVAMAAGALLAFHRIATTSLDWDGYAIWQLKAKGLADGSIQEQLRDPGYAYAHPDYPLLVPAHTWWSAGGAIDDKLAQAATAVFLADLLIVLYWAVRFAPAARPTALGACVVVLSWELTRWLAASGFADLPMAAYVLAVAFALGGPSPAWLAVLLAGALSTKNEGLFVLLATASWMAAIAGGRDRKTLYRLLPAVLAGIGGAVPWLLVRWRWDLRGDVLNVSSVSVARIAGAPGRVPLILQEVARSLAGLGASGAVFGLLPLVVASAVVLSVSGPSRLPRLFGFYACAYSLGILAAYALTPHDVLWHIGTSFDRLAFQVAPVAVAATLAALVPSSADDAGAA